MRNEATQPEAFAKLHKICLSPPIFKNRLWKQDFLFYKPNSEQEYNTLPKCF